MAGRLSSVDGALALAIGGRTSLLLAAPRAWHGHAAMHYYNPNHYSIVDRKLNCSNKVTSPQF
jgi:hypothetical protein